MSATGTAERSIAFIGFGEAAMAFVDGWGAGRTFPITAYDIKTDHASADISARKFTDYREHGVDGAGTSHDAVAGVGIVFSTVTADQALVAAEAAAPHIVAGTLYLDCNSCAPETKRRAGAVIDAARGRYVDVAVMAPVHPRLHKTPLLVSGPHAATALDALNKLDMAASIATGDVGKASSIKMIRSVMIKGLEALVVECVLAGRRAGVDEIVLDSLEATYPGFDWKRRAAYMLERVMVHGVRRAAEMREVARTVDDLGLAGRMSRAAVDWQQQIGDLDLGAEEGGYGRLADLLLDRLDRDEDRGGAPIAPPNSGVVSAPDRE